MMDPNFDIVPTLRMFDGLMMNKAADEIDRLRLEVARLSANVAHVTERDAVLLEAAAIASTHCSRCAELIKARMGSANVAQGAEAVVNALEETQGLLVAMLHEKRPAQEIEQQIGDNRTALQAFAAATPQSEGWRKDAERPEWADCETRGAMVRNSLRHRKTELREAAKKLRKAYRQDFMRISCEWLADAYDAAAAVLEQRYSAIAALSQNKAGEKDD
jgi:hypothetical protein